MRPSLVISLIIAYLLPTVQVGVVRLGHEVWHGIEAWQAATHAHAHTHAHTHAAAGHQHTPYVIFVLGLDAAPTDADDAAPAVYSPLQPDKHVGESNLALWTRTADRPVVASDPCKASCIPRHPPCPPPEGY
ncbi:MAG: hypothetical protein OHK0039_27130 [Bacteroidia bacterium]